MSLPKPMAPMSLRALLGLGGLVIALHLLLLREPWGSAAPPDRWKGQPLVTRSVVMQPPPEAAPVVQAAPARSTARSMAASPAPVSARPSSSAASAVAPALAPTTEGQTTPDSAQPAPSEAGAGAGAAQAPASDQAAEKSIPVQAGSEMSGASSEASPSAAAPLLIPGSVRLRYDIRGEVKGLSYHANGDLRWRHDGQSYEARLEVGAFLLGSRVQTSVGQITAQGLAPRRFGDKTRSEVAAHFERDKGQIIFSAHVPPAQLLPLSQDQLSIFVQLASLLAGEASRYPAGSTLELPVATAREYGVWRFVIGETERLSLPGGELDAVRISRGPRHPYDLNVEVWLAPHLGYLPARIRLTQSNGDSIDQLWRSTVTP